MGCQSQEQGGSSGLAFLVHSNPASDDAPSQTALLLDYVFQLPQPASDIVSRSGEIAYPDLNSRVTQHIDSLKQQQAAPSPAAAEAGPSSSSGLPALPEQPRGRVGPRDVAIDRSSVCGSFGFSTDGLSLEALGNFTSCRANVAVFAGKWFYECTVLTSGIQQIGWATIHCPFTAEEGVGDAPDSYAVDGKRLRKWNVKPQPYGESWVQGDVMGCGIDLDAGSITFWRNGQSLGVAYDRVCTMQPSLAYFPAVSLSHTERCTLNFGAKPFTYPVEGYQPLQAAPSAADRVAAQYCCSCLARLALAAVERVEHGGSDGGSSAAATAVAAPEKEYSLADHLEGATVSSGPSAAASVAAVAAAAAAAAAARAPTGGTAAVGGLAAGWAPPFTGPPQTVSSADMLLLGAVVLGPLQELLVLQPYLVQYALMPLLTELQRMAGEGPVQPQLQVMLQLMHVVWDDSFRHILFAVLEEVAYRCQVSPLLVQDYPYTAAYPHLQLAGSLLQHKPTMRLFVKHPDFYIVMEGLLARKAPSPKDLQQLLPHVWWRGCKDETTSEERLRASVSIITTTVAKVEQRQYELLELLLATPWSDDAPGSSASSTSSSASTGSSCALLVFLRFLLQKNMYALRDVPPPGLSEPTVLMSAFFGLLQMLQPALQAACDSGSGPLAAFPAAELFAGVGPAAEAEPVFNMPRLGGVVTHLAREHPITAAEKQPVAVLLQQQQQVGRRAEGSAYGGSPHLQDAWVPELLNSCLLLYAWRVGFNYKMIHNLSSTVVSSSTALEDLDRMIAQNEGQQMSSWLHGTRKVYYDELSRDVRLLTLLCVAFFSPGKQQALCNLSRYLAQLTTAVSNTQPSPSPAAQAAVPAAPAAAAAAGGEQQQSQQQHAEAPAAAQPAAAAAAPGAGPEGENADAGLSNLLRYVPLVYVEVVADFLTALRKSADCAVGTPAMELQPQAADAFIAWACSVLNNPRIANPGIQESLLAVVGLLLDNPAWRELLEQQQGRARCLVGALLQVFDSRLWHPTTGVLLKVVQNSGFGHPVRQAHPSHSLQHVLISLLQEGTAPAAAVAASAATTPTSPQPQQQEQEQAADAAASPLPSPAAGRGPAGEAGAARPVAVARGFVNRLFSTLNWTLTEFTVAVGELHNLRGQRSILEVQNQYRRTGLMFELSVNFLRLLEFVVPTPAFLASGVNRTRLRELLQFVLSHFTNGPDARRLNELLQTSQPVVASSSSGGGAPPTQAAGAAGAAGAPPPIRQGPMQPSPAAVAAVAAAAPLAGGPLSAGGVAQGAPGVPAYALQALRLESSSLSERVQKTALLAPLVGIFLALWDSYLAATATAVPSLGPAAAAAAAAAAALDGEVAAAMAAGGSGSSSGGGSGGSRGEAAVLQELAEMADDRFMASLRFLQDVDWSAAFPSQPLSVPLRAFGQLIDAVTAARAEQAAAAAAQALPEEVPDDFQDPITMELMRDPVVLPDSQIVVDRSTIERHLLSSATDPFSRAPLAMEQLQPASDISRRMKEWVEQHRAAASAQQTQEQA